MGNVIDETLFKADTAESKARVELPIPEEAEYTFSGTLSITRDQFCFQLPPNQFGPDVDLEKVNIDINKSKYLSGYLPPDVIQITYQYRFFLEPEEMREYIGIGRPTEEQIGVAKQEKADRYIKKYLKDVNPREENKTMLEQTKIKTIKNILDKTSIPPKNVHFNSDDTNKDLKSNISAKACRMPNVLSWRSLQILSRYVENGFTLAVLLNVPDSVINTIGFDSLSSRDNVAEVSNKVLLHWKEMVPEKKRSNMVPQLINSLQEMNLDAIAKAIQTASNNNEELTHEHFLKSPNYSTKIISQDHIKQQKESVYQLTNLRSLIEEDQAESTSYNDILEAEDPETK